MKVPVNIKLSPIPIGAHRFGRATQRPKGVNVGRRAFYDGAFLMQPVNAKRPLIFERKDNWFHRLSSGYVLVSPVDRYLI